MCRNLTQEFDSEIELPIRSYRRTMKPILPRKTSSSARINLNKFWNDLEEFYSNFNGSNSETIKTTVETLPDYTTDVFNHDREAAENDLNEMLERSSCSSYSSTSSDVDCLSVYSSDDGFEDWDDQSDFSSYMSYSSSIESIPSCSGDSVKIRPPKTLLPFFKKTWKKILAF